MVKWNLDIELVSNGHWTWEYHQKNQKTVKQVKNIVNLLVQNDNFSYKGKVNKYTVLKLQVVWKKTQLNMNLITCVSKIKRNLTW